MKNIAEFFGLRSKKDNITDEQNRDLAEILGSGSVDIAETEDYVDSLPEKAVEPIMAEVQKKQIMFVDTDKIVPNPFQPRKTFTDNALTELADSIKEYGVIQPLVVRKTAADCYELVAGERRLRASKLAGLAQVPVIRQELTDKETAELAMIENLQREDLHFIEEAEGFQRLLTGFGYTQEALARQMGKSQSTIANKLRILRLTDSVRQKIFKNGLTERHARALLRLPTEQGHMVALNYIIEKKLNVKETEMLVQAMLEQHSAPKNSTANPGNKKQKPIAIIKDVRIFLNTINKIVSDMKKTGLKVKVDKEQSEEYITVTMRIPTKKK